MQKSVLLQHGSLTLFLECGHELHLRPADFPFQPVEAEGMQGVDTCDRRAWSAAG